MLARTSSSARRRGTPLSPRLIIRSAVPASGVMAPRVARAMHSLSARVATSVATPSAMLAITSAARDQRCMT